jgi:hypothetical protein
MHINIITLYPKKSSGEMLALIQLIASGAMFSPDVVASHYQVVIFDLATIRISEICGVISSIDVSNLKVLRHPGEPAQDLQQHVSLLNVQLICCNCLVHYGVIFNS